MGSNVLHGDGGSLKISRLDGYKTKVDVVGKPRAGFITESMNQVSAGEGSGTSLFSDSKEGPIRSLLLEAGFVSEHGEPGALVYPSRIIQTPSVAHTAIRVISMERSLSFYGLFGFVVARKFLTSGVRAAWLSSPYMTLELIEVPEKGAGEPHELWEDAYRRGQYHICFDVTADCTSLDAYWDGINAASKEKFGLVLKTLRKVKEQMMYDLVCDVAFTKDPDGTIIELIRRKMVIKHRMEPDW